MTSQQSSIDISTDTPNDAAITDKKLTVKNQNQHSTNEENHDTERPSLPCPPLEPEEKDCCGSGCTPCVFDIYEQDLRIWKQECQKIQNQRKQGNQISGSVLSDSEYRKFQIMEVKQETKNCFRYRIQLPEFSSLGLAIGQHIIIRDTNNGMTLSRQYTPVSEITCVGHFDLLIKIYELGKMSQCVKKWKVGTEIEIRGPFGNFQYQANKYKKLILLAAGTGIAPMSQIIQGILGNEEDDTMIQLLYACRSYDEILMKSELNEWSSFWNFSATFVLSQEPEAGYRHYRYGDQVDWGRMNQEFISKALLPSDINPATFLLVCGTKSFENDMIEICRKLGLCDTQIHRF
uniref:NADH-cytochrome b5 reductase n=1 Tax=Crassostrea virginica TaxID=6565 RepID=A0A8B8CH42_CRAVI|nr:NADH-cytochrome b5 reductase-like [Crassostrea virginica]XP_022315132.1 NADH-cytochrome b5 reductase-like [Crassostrea virginica]XP_022315133.1 NADH-cytochrome b5 reductase-like [Crassostrea virginica]